MTNPIADPLVEGPDTDVLSSLVDLDASPSGVAVVTINRPDRKNAFNAEVIAALSQHFETLRDADGVRIVFLRGAGGAFSAGADLDWMAAAAGWTKDENRQDAMALADMLLALRELPQFTVAWSRAGVGGGRPGGRLRLRGGDTGREVRLLRGQAGPGGGDHQPACGRRHRPAPGQEPVRHRPDVRRGLRREDRPGRRGGGRRRRPRRRHGTAGRGNHGLRARAVARSKTLVDDVAGVPIDEELLELTARLIADQRTSEEGQEGVAAFLEKRKPGWAV